ncbi:MAG: leucine-rich repeat protein, partial [Clostridia bacterium]|nr:leucine-rich repeat protein [Clostridia bacterium]
DGTGDGYSLGSKLYAAWDEKPELYCIWAKISPETDFEYETAPEGAAVTSYKGNAETVVIPPELGGVPVVRVKRDAFRSKSFKTLVIPKSVLYVESNAFGTTSAFTTLYLWDTILSIPDNAFTNQTGFANFRLNASLDPTYTNETEGNFVIKWCRFVSLSKAAKKPMFILVSGSSSLYGLNSAKMEGYLGGRYDVVNYGTQAGSSSVFYLEAISRYVHEGDIIVHAPEMGTATMGGTELSWRIFRGTEAYYNIWREVDMRNYTGVFSALTEFNATRIHMTPLNYLTISNNINEYGDCKNRDGYDKLNKENYSGGSNFSLSTGTLNAARAKTLNAAYARLIAKGAKVYMSCAPCNLNAVRSERRTDAAKTEYMEALRKQISVPLISFIGDYMFEGKYMYNSDYHLNAFGRDIRTERLFEDLQKQFEKEERERQR